MSTEKSENSHLEKSFCVVTLIGLSLLTLTSLYNVSVKYNNR